MFLGIGIVPRMGRQMLAPGPLSRGRPGPCTRTPKGCHSMLSQSAEKSLELGDSTVRLALLEWLVQQMGGTPSGYGVGDLKTPGW